MSDYKPRAGVVLFEALKHFSELHYNAATTPRVAEYAAQFKKLADETADLCDRVDRRLRANGCTVTARDLRGLPA